MVGMTTIKNTFNNQTRVYKIFKDIYKHKLNTSEIATKVTEFFNDPKKYPEIIELLNKKYQEEKEQRKNQPNKPKKQKEKVEKPNMYSVRRDGKLVLVTKEEYQKIKGKRAG